MMQIRRVCVFCGSSPGTDPRYLEAARATGTALVRRNIGLVYGGGSSGLMGTLADTVMAAGGQAIGTIPQVLAAREVAHHGLTELRIVQSMHERKATMADLADGFVALPGGYGTFEELCEVITWAQLGLHQKPCGILNVGGYYDPLLLMFERAIRDGFIKPVSRSLVLQETDPDRLLDLLEDYQLTDQS